MVAEHRWALRRGREVLLCVVVAVGACGNDRDDEAAPSTAPDDRSAAEQLVAELDCEKETSADTTFENSRWPFIESIDCWTDGRPSIRIHTFDALSASEVSDRFQQRYDPGVLNQCPTGELSHQYVAVGDTWAAVTTSEALRDRVLDKLGGSVTSPDDKTTPMSYPMVDPCPDSPPISVG